MAPDFALIWDVEHVPYEGIKMRKPGVVDQTTPGILKRG